MSRFVTAVAFVFLVGCASHTAPISQAAPAVRKLSELPDGYRLLQGTWSVTRAELGGQPVPERLGAVMHHEGNRFWFEGESGFEVVDIDAESNPHRIDFWEGGTAVQGVYRLDGDELTTCSAPPGVPRPSSVDRCSRPQYILATARRTTEPR